MYPPATRSPEPTPLHYFHSLRLASLRCCGRSCLCLVHLLSSHTCHSPVTATRSPGLPSRGKRSSPSIICRGALWPSRAVTGCTCPLPRAVSVISILPPTLMASDKWARPPAGLKQEPAVQSWEMFSLEITRGGLAALVTAHGTYLSVSPPKRFGLVRQVRSAFITATFVGRSDLTCRSDLTYLSDLSSEPIIYTPSGRSELSSSLQHACVAVSTQTYCILQHTRIVYCNTRVLCPVCL